MPDFNCLLARGRSILLAIPSCWLIVSGALAQPTPPANQPGVMLTTADGCHAWLFTAGDKPVTATSAKWSGACRNGNTDGAGAMLVELADGRTMRFDGMMVNGLASGRGLLTLPDRKFYDGGFYGGLFEGRGIMYGPDGSSVATTFSAGFVAGPVTMIMPGIGRIEGDLSNDLSQGKVVVKFQNGNVFNGYMKNYKLAGRGTMDFADGSRYVGDWQDGFPDGEGTLTLATGRVIEGAWRRGCHSEGNRMMSLMVPPSTCQ